MCTQCVALCLKAKTQKKFAWELVSVYTTRSNCHSSIADSKVKIEETSLLSLIRLTAPSQVVAMEHLLNKSAEAQMAPQGQGKAYMKNAPSLSPAPKLKTRLRRSGCLCSREDRWLGYATEKKTEVRKKSGTKWICVMSSRGNQTKGRELPEHTYKVFTEEIYQEKFGTGLTALSYTATRVPTTLTEQSTISVSDPARRPTQ